VLKHNALLGLQHRDWLIEHQDEFPELKPFLGKIYIDFPGIVVGRPRWRSSRPYCVPTGSRWGGYWHWLSLDFDAGGRIAFGK